MNIKVSRNPLFYFLHITLILFLYLKAFHFGWEREFFFDVLLRVIYFPVAIVYLLRITFWPYIEIKNNTLTIHRDYLMDESFDATQIEKIEISSSPFKDSYFVLKNYIRYDFKYFDVADSSFEKLIAEIDKPIVDI